jgi:aromatic-L-amino-acid/L-tryptophan decarboxylase
VAADPEAAEEQALSFRDDGAAALEWAARYLERVRELPVLAQVEPGEIRARLPQSPPDRAEPFADVLRDLDEVLLPGVTNWQHPRFFAYFANTASAPGILAELLAATLNQVGILWRTAPALAELEFLTLDWLAQLLGLPRGWLGHIEDTASTATLAACIVARDVTGRNTVLVSEQAHSSGEKAARMLGMELRKVPVDDEWRMRPDALELSDAAIVIATVGTTGVTAVDPVAEIARAAHAGGAWLHVDAAYAGSAWVCPELRWTQAGVELADSLVVNAHKWLLTPMDCSCLWTSRPDDFRNAFSLVPDYLRTSDDATSLSELSPVLGRRFRALKLWAVLRCHGREGLQAMIREHVRLAELFESWVRDEPGWEVVAPRHFSLVCFRRIASDEENATLMERVNSTGEMFLSHTMLDGRYILRLAIGNAHTTESDVRQAWDVLRGEAER